MLAGTEVSPRGEITLRASDPAVRVEGSRGVAAIIGFSVGCTDDSEYQLPSRLCVLRIRISADGYVLVDRSSSLFAGCGSPPLPAKSTVTKEKSQSTTGLEGK